MKRSRLQAPVCKHLAAKTSLLSDAGLLIDELQQWVGILLPIANNVLNLPQL